MNESVTGIKKENLLSACNIVQNDLNFLKRALENPEISELDILKYLKSTELGLLVASYEEVVEKQQKLSQLQAQSNNIDYTIKK